MADEQEFFRHLRDPEKWTKGSLVKALNFGMTEGGIIVPMTAGGSSGGGSDPDSAREATLARLQQDFADYMREAFTGEGLRFLNPEIVPLTFDPWTANIGGEQGIEVPEGANVGLLTIFQGQIQGGYRSLTYAPIYGVESSIMLRDAQLQDWRMSHAGDVDSLIRVDFWHSGALRIPVGVE